MELHEKVGSEHPSQSNVGSQVIPQTFKPLCLTCSLCNKEIGLIEGDVIFGEKWYHQICWQSLNSKVEGI